MTSLAAYDRLCAALSQARDVGQVLAIRDELAHVKLYARRILDRALLAEATVVQLRAERHLGRLLIAAKSQGHLREGRPATKAPAGDALPEHDPAPAPATLKEIGVDKKLSSTAQRAAALDDEAFELILSETRDKIRGGKAILVDPIARAGNLAEHAQRRADHAARTRAGGRVEDLGALARSGKRFASIGADPQWKFLTRSISGEGRSANLHYRTEEVDKIKALPVGDLLAEDGAFYMWMVDWCPQDALDLLAHWGLRHVTTAFTWVKQNPSGEVWHMGQGYWTRANPEQCWLATKGRPKRLNADVRQLIVAPVMEHSRKPDAWLEGIERLTAGDYLELQARRTRPGWVSWGDELEWTGAPK